MKFKSLYFLVIAIFWAETQFAQSLKTVTTMPSARCSDMRFDNGLYFSGFKGTIQPGDVDADIQNKFSHNFKIISNFENERFSSDIGELPAELSNVISVVATHEPYTESYQAIFEGEFEINSYMIYFNYSFAASFELLESFEGSSVELSFSDRDGNILGEHLIIDASSSLLTPVKNNLYSKVVKWLKGSIDVSNVQGQFIKVRIKSSGPKTKNSNPPSYSTRAYFAGSCSEVVVYDYETSLCANSEGNFDFRGKVDGALDNLNLSTLVVNSVGFDIQDEVPFPEDGVLGFKSLGYTSGVIELYYRDLNAGVDYKVNLTVNIDNCDPEPVECPEFYLEKDKEYYLTYWSKNSVNPSGGRGVAELSLDFFSGSNYLLQVGPFVNNPLKDGQWVRREVKFRSPKTPCSVRLNMNNTGTESVNFDDIRVIPVNASAVSYIYDHSTRRLTAELDQNNYATFYEYDNEGNLVRIKKETETGIHTIQESRIETVKASKP